MKEQWMVYGKKADFKEIGKRFGIDQVTARIMRNRGVEGDAAMEQYLHGSLKDCPSPSLLKDMDQTVEILVKKLREGKRIRVIGDYDIDGVCATYILVKALRRAGGRVDSDIPDRIRDGYGINIHIIERAAEEGVDTLLTCDNGIAAREQTRYAREKGMTVLITDHHEVPFEDEEDGTGAPIRRELLPEADAVVNPHRKDCPYPFKELCGAAVAFKAAQALYERLGIPREELSPFVEAAGLATVGDVMPLRGENRILVKEALARMRASRIPGLKALMEVCGLKPEQVGSYHLGFVLGPCLNAGGRLDTAKKSLALMLAEEGDEALEAAWELKALNDRRKDMTAKNVDDAIYYIEETGIKKDDVYVVFLPECHESLAGIVAGRIRERYQHPVFVITRAEKGLKGSGRSIPAYPMYERLCACGEYLTAFGGHPMAAGLSLPEENLEPFRRALNENSGLKEPDFAKRLWIDVPMPFSYVTEGLVRELSLLEPFGNGNEKPLFAQKGLTVLKKNLIGKNRNVLKLLLADASGLPVQGILFGEAEEADRRLSAGDRISAAYYPDINEYMGKKSLQMVIQSFQKEE